MSPTPLRIFKQITSFAAITLLCSSKAKRCEWWRMLRRSKPFSVRQLRLHSIVPIYKSTVRYRSQYWCNEHITVTVRVFALYPARVRVPLACTSVVREKRSSWVANGCALKWFTKTWYTITSGMLCAVDQKILYYHTINIRNAKSTTAGIGSCREFSGDQAASLSTRWL
jgi:hypothetical protein